MDSPIGILVVWLFMAFVVERLVEVVLRVFPMFDHKKIGMVNIAMVLTLVFSLVIAFGASLDFFEMFGITFQWPYVGPVVSALLMMGGSSLVHDVIQWVQANKETAKAWAAPGPQPSTTVPAESDTAQNPDVVRYTSGVPPN